MGDPPEHNAKPSRAQGGSGAGATEEFIRRERLSAPCTPRLLSQVLWVAAFATAQERQKAEKKAQKEAKREQKNRERGARAQARADMEAQKAAARAQEKQARADMEAQARAAQEDQEAARAAQRAAQEKERAAEQSRAPVQPDRHAALCGDNPQTAAFLAATAAAWRPALGVKLDAYQHDHVVARVGTLLRPMLPPGCLLHEEQSVETLFSLERQVPQCTVDDCDPRSPRHRTPHRHHRPDLVLEAREGMEVALLDVRIAQIPQKPK